MIKIFNSNDKNFSSNGNIVINPLKCLETKKKSLNGWYLEIEVPIEYKDYIEKDKLVVVKVKSKLNSQAFRINDNIEYSTRKISFTADHVMFDSKNYFLLDVRPTNMSALNSLMYINERTDNTSPFTIKESNVEGIDTSYFIRKSLFEAWTVIEEKYNGVFDADNFDINFNISTGVDRGEVICYGKNAQSVKIFEDWSEVCTKLYPVGKDGLLLPEKFLESNKQYSQPYTRTKSFETSLDEENQTEENLIVELRANAENYLNNHNEPKVSYEVKSDINQLCEIGDTIHVKQPLINLITNVIEYEYDTNLEKIKTLTFGNYTRDVKAKFDSIKSSINILKDTVNTQSTIINEQADLINSLNKNGYVYIDDNEILILDSLPKENAQNVWRFGLGGIGFSTHGYEGPFETAITQDGKINANFIQVGQMSTSRIQGLDELILEINKIVNLTKNVKNINYLFIGNAMSGQLQELTIEGNINLIYPNNNLYPSDNLYPIDTYLIVDISRTLTENAKRYHLPFNSLSTNEKFKYSKGKCYLIHSDESIEELDDIEIELFEGNNYIYLESFQNNIELSAKYVVKNEYTDVFSTKAEMNSAINQNNQTIDLKLEKKTDKDNLIAQINMSTEKDKDGSYIGIEADKLNFKGKKFNLTTDEMEINSTNFSVDKDGKMKATAGEIAGFNIDKDKFSVEVADKYTYDNNDLAILSQIISSGNTPSTEQLDKYDLNHDGILDNLDLLWLQSKVFGFNSTKGSVSINTTDANSVISCEGNSPNTLKTNIGIETITTNTFKGKSATIAGEITCQSVTQTSLEKVKKNIKKLTNAKEIFDAVDIYKYNYKNEQDNDKKHIGLIIGNKYKYSKEITSKNNDAVDLNSMLSVLWQVVKEQQEEIKELKEMIKSA